MKLNIELIVINIQLAYCRLLRAYFAFLVLSWRFFLLVLWRTVISNSARRISVSVLDWRYIVWFGQRILLYYYKFVLELDRSYRQAFCFDNFHHSAWFLLVLAAPASNGSHILCYIAVKYLDRHPNPIGQ